MPEPAEGKEVRGPGRGFARLRDRALGLLDRVTLAFNVVGTLLIGALMLLICADVAGRQAFNTPIAGVPELVSLSIVAIVFLQVPQALRSGRFTRSDALLSLAWAKKPRLALAMEVVFDAVAILVVGALLYAAWPLFVKDWQRGTFVGAVGDFTAPLWPVKLVLVLGTALLIAQFAARLLRLLAGEEGGNKRETSP